MEEFKEYYRAEYGKYAIAELEDRLKRVEEKGTSSHIENSIDDLILGNRAGENEKELSKEEILEQYCVTPK